MKVLIACEYSGVSRRAFEALGHEVEKRAYTKCHRHQTVGKNAAEHTLELQQHGRNSGEIYETMPM